MAEQKSNFIDQIGRNATPLLLLAGGAIAYFKIILPLLKGVKDTAEGASNLLNPFADSPKDIKDKEKIEITKNENFFDADYLVELQKKNYCLILSAYGQKLYSGIIYNAKGFFNDDEAAIYGVFRTLKTKTQVSSLSKGFFDMYKTDLYGFMQNFLDTNELGIISEICNKLPIGITDSKGNIIK